MSESKLASSPSVTPLHTWHSASGGRMVDFAGFEMPIQYSTIVAEHTATRTAAGLFDISHMGRLRFEGDRAGELLDHLLTRRVMDMQMGQVRYSLVCDENGGILDDVLVSRLESPSGRQFYLLVVNASNRAKILKWLLPHLADFPDVTFNDATDSTAMVSLQGPSSVAIVERIFPAKVLRLGYYRALVTEQMSKPCIVSRTGYTGEDGFEFIVRAEDAIRVWQNLLLAGREHAIRAVGLGARDTLRLEAGMPLYGHELSDEMDPLTAGLGFAVNFKDRSFIGDESLRRRKENPASTCRVGLKLSGRRPARQGAKLVDSDRRGVGIVTSGTFSPTLQCPIAMAYLDRQLAIEGSSIDVDIRGSTASAEIVKLPFYQRPL